MNILPWALQVLLALHTFIGAMWKLVVAAIGAFIAYGRSVQRPL
jgi:hypothetical protein